VAQTIEFHYGYPVHQNTPCRSMTALVVHTWPRSHISFITENLLCKSKMSEWGQSRVQLARRRDSITLPLPFRTLLWFFYYLETRKNQRYWDLLLRSPGTKRAPQATRSP
jgi:hypothetical protein